MYISTLSSSSSHADCMKLPNSITIHPYRPSLLSGLLNCIQCLHRADICKSLPVGQNWHIHM